MKYYCIGIKGAGMATLAGILHDLGHDVIGYDDYQGYKFTQAGIDERGITIYYGHNHELASDTIVTFSKAFNADHPEIQRVKKMGLQVENYNDLLGSLSAKFKTIGVSGMHGKTTTSTMLATVLNNTVGCNYFIGDGTGYAKKENELFVLESCEYQKHFLAYHPYYAIVTNIELEHTECYKDLEEIIETYTIFANKANFVIACGDDANVRKMKLTTDVTYYGFNADNDVVAQNIVTSESGSEFDIYISGEYKGHFSLPLYGNHMILNALACIAICLMNGISCEDIQTQLSKFENAKRRFKESKVGDYIVIDDYAHHPTEIEVTIASARQKYPNKKIVAIFLPNTYSRTQDLHDGFVAALKTADKAFMMDIHCDRENPEDYPNVSSDNIIKQVPGCEKIALDTVTKLYKYSGSVLCFMSCTNIYELIEAFIENM